MVHDFSTHNITVPVCTGQWVSTGMKGYQYGGGGNTLGDQLVIPARTHSSCYKCSMGAAVPQMNQLMAISLFSIYSTSTQRGVAVAA